MSSIAFPNKLGFGGAPLGNMYAPVDDETAQATLVAAWDTGVRHFDTAPNYGCGQGEHRFGDVLRRYPREDYLLSTKVGRLNRPFKLGAVNDIKASGPSSAEAALFKGGFPFEIEVDYGYEAAMRSVEDSCQRLGMTQIDIVYVHDLGADHLGDAWEAQFDLAIDGCFRALSELRDQGVIKAWGLGNNVVEPLIRAMERSDPDIFQLAGRYTLLDQSALERVFPMCIERKIPVVVGGPYNSDLLAGGEHYDYRKAEPVMLARRDRIAQMCTRHRVDMRAVALQFCAAHPAVGAVLPGTKSPEKARRNAELMESSIPQVLWQELRAENIIPPNAPTPAA